MTGSNDKKWNNRRSVWVSRVAFLLLSAFIWVLLKLGSRDMATTIVLPVNLIDTPQDVMLIDPLKEVRVRSHASGVYLIRANWTDPDPVDISFDLFHKYEGGRYYLTGEDLTDAISEFAPSGTAWESMGDTLWIGTSSLLRKAIPVMTDLNLEFEPPFYKSGEVEVLPDSIYVFGPAEVLDTISVYRLPHYSAQEVEEDITASFEIRLPGNVHSPTSSVRIRQEVAPFTEKWLEIEVDDPPGAFSWKAVPERVRVKCRVAVSDYDRLHSGLFKATYTRLESGDAEVPVRWEHIPSFAEITDWMPKYLELMEVQ